MRKIIAILLSSFSTVALGQIGGNHSFDFLQMPSHARVSALGGVNVSLADKDVNFFHNNPALAGDTLNGVIAAGYQYYVGDVGNALFTYAHAFPRAGQFIFGVQHTDYGTLSGYDERGNTTQEYTAGETAVLIGRTHQIGHIRIGAGLKAVFSNIAGYRSNAVLLDVGGIFKYPETDLAFGLAIKNVGIVLHDYRESGSGYVPFDVQAGVTFKPEHMPVRFSVTAYNLVESDLLSVNNAPGFRRSALEKFFAHISAGAEILLHRNVNALFGYNYLLHQALKMETGKSGGGICYGFSIFVKPVEFVFSRSAYTAGNAGYSFTLSTNTNQFLKKREF